MHQTRSIVTQPEQLQCMQSLRACGVRCRTGRQFTAWAWSTAAVHGYDVELSGLGRATDEEAARAAAPALQEAGFSTQVPCFMGTCMLLLAAAQRRLQASAPVTVCLTQLRARRWPSSRAGPTRGQGRATGHHMLSHHHAGLTTLLGQ